MALKTISSISLELIRRATPTPQLTQAKVRLNPSLTNKSLSSAKSTWIMGIVLTKKGASSLMDLINSVKTISTTPSIKQRNVVVLKTTITVFTETDATSFM